MLIYHKTDKGFVYLTLNGQANRISEIKRLLIKVVGNFYEQGLSVVKTGKSCAIRLRVPEIDFMKAFEIQMEAVQESFIAIKKLFVLANELDLADIDSCTD